MRHEETMGQRFPEGEDRNLIFAFFAHSSLLRAFVAYFNFWLT